MKALLSFIAILLLTTSSLPAGFADITPVDSSNITLVEQPIIQTRKTISINLDEIVGLSTDTPKKNEIQNTTFFIAYNTSKIIHLDEDLSMKSSTHDQKVHYDYVTIQPQPTVERILQTDKLCDDRKKNLKVDLLNFDDLDQQKSDNLISIDSTILQTTFFADPFNLVFNLISEQNLLEFVNIFEEQSITNIYNSVSNFDPSFLFDNSFVVVIFAPLVFFLFIFAEDVKFKFEKVRPFLSFIFIVIILSTVVVTPYSVSSVYWPEAYADTDNMDESIYDNTTASTDNISSSSTPAEDTETVEDSTSVHTDASVGSTSSSSTPAEDTESTEVSSTNSTATEVIPTNSTATEVIPTNSTATEVIPTNSTTTDIIPVNGTVIPGTNSTDIIPVNGTICRIEKVRICKATNSTDIIPVNGTVIPGTNSTDIIPVNGTVIPGTNSTIVIVPNATESWSFDTQINGSRFIGDVYIEESDSSLILDGDGYLSNDGNSTSDLSNISVTAWVNPDSFMKLLGYARIYFGLPFRQTEGMIRAYCNRIPAVPDFTPVHKRVDKLDIKIDNSIGDNNEIILAIIVQESRLQTDATEMVHEKRVSKNPCWC